MALRQFAEHGFAGTVVDKVVEAARVNKRMVYHYFGSKEDLYCAVLEVAFERFAQIDAELFHLTGDPSSAIQETVRIYFRFLRGNPDLVQLLLWENLQKGKFVDRIAGRVVKNPMLDYLQKVIEAGIASGAFRRDLHVKHLLINLIGLSLVYFSNRYTLSNTVDLDLGKDEVLEAAADHAAKLVLLGISASRAG